MLADLGDAEFAALLAQLVSYRLLRYNEVANTYTTHPLVRSHYLALLTRSGQAEQTHDQLKDYYLELAGDTPYNPTLADLAPLIEVVYHACRAGAYDEAYKIHDERIMQKESGILVHRFGAYETELALMVQFYSDGDISQEPQVNKAIYKSWVLNTTGLCLMSLGQLEAAVPFYDRAASQYQQITAWRDASNCYQNLANVNILLGQLVAATTVSDRALALAYKTENYLVQCQSMSWLAFAYYLQGNMESAQEWFQKAEEFEQKHEPGIRHLYSNRGIFHAEQLRKIGQFDYARKVTEENVRVWVNLYKWPVDASSCERIFGELSADESNHKSAHNHFNAALSIARTIFARDILIEALLARGRWAARLVVAHPDLTGAPEASTTTTIVPGHLSGFTSLQQAFADLREALGYATDGGYRRYEADSRIALAWAHLASGNPTAAKQEATRAQTMSLDMGYHWGQVDAAEVLALLP